MVYIIDFKKSYIIFLLIRIPFTFLTHVLKYKPKGVKILNICLQFLLLNTYVLVYKKSIKNPPLKQL